MNSRLEYFRQRTEEGIYDLYETVTDFRKVIVAKVIDIALFTSGLAAIIYVLVTTHWLANYLIGVTVIIYAGLYILLKAITRGMTVGYLLMGIRFINVRTKQVVTLQEYLAYVKKSTKMEIRYSQIFRYYLNYDGRLVQNEPMKKFGMVLCDSKKYKKFLKEYNYNQKQYNMLLQQVA